jgi:hypothetical protein
MYNKDSLKPNKGRKLNNVIAVLMSALLATGVMIGCGSKAVDPGGGTDAETDVGNVEANVGETETDSVIVAEDTVSENSAEDLPPLAYKTVEERQAQHVLDEDLKPMGTHAFLMIEDVINEPDEGWEAAAKDALNNDYLKLKGTLYEVNYYDEPAIDLVYFPGDELPEGYSVDVTEDYEAIVTDSERIGEGHEFEKLSTLLAIEKDGEIAYEFGIGFKDRFEIPEKDYDLNREEFVAKYGHFTSDVTIEPGMYVILHRPTVIGGISSGYYITQALTKEDLEKLPAGTTIAHGVGHY